MNKKFLILIIAAVFILSACKPNLGSGSSNLSNNQNGQIKVGQPAPKFELESFDGDTVSLASLEGKAVFVDFWAGWCPFCIGEMPEIEKISNEFGEDLVVLGIHRTDTEDLQTGREFAKKVEVTYQLLKDTDGSLYKTYGAGQSAMPLAAFIDKEGNISKIFFGPKTESQMRDNVNNII